MSRRSISPSQHSEWQRKTASIFDASRRFGIGPIGIVAALGVLGCVVATLPAQESSRRTATKYRTEVPGNASVRPNLSPPSELPPIIPGRGRTTAQSEASQEQYALPATVPPGQFSGAGLPAAEQTNSTDVAPPAELEDSKLRSVLKRSQAPSAFEPQPGSSLTPPASASVSNELLRRVESGPTGTLASPTATSATKSAATATRPGQAISASNKNAALRVEINGPQGVTVGKPAAYSVTINNDSDTTAEEVIVRLSLPSWVTVQATQPTNGETSTASDTQGSGRLVWSLPRVTARGREQLKLQIVTKEADGFDVAAEWTAKPAATRAAIIVKQAQLAMALAGPADMTFGEEKTFTLTVSNPGTGDAERVMVSVASGNAPAQQFDAGMIPAGHKKEVPLAVVASQTGSIDLLISAAAENGLEARTSHKITVRKAEVNVAIEGPPIKYAGSEAIYVVAVTNSGTATADNVNLSLNLPAGAKYVGGIDGATAAPGAVRWRIATLGPGGQREYEVRVQLSVAGAHRIEVQSQAAASGTANCFAETEVEAVSDLKLVVNDPSGPTPIGEHAVYELQLINRGSQAAKQVRIVMQFSEGVEPISFDGCDARIVPGQILCQPLAQLGPGEQATLRVKAQAHQPGAHHFRIEVTTAEDDARLVSEGTTRFFADGGRGAAATTARRANSSGTSIPTTIR